MDLLRNLAPRCCEFSCPVPSSYNSSSYRTRPTVSYRLMDLPRFPALKCFTPNVVRIVDLETLMTTFRFGESLRTISPICLAQFFDPSTEEGYREAEKNQYVDSAIRCVDALTRCSCVTVRDFSLVVLMRVVPNHRLYRSESRLRLALLSGAQDCCNRGRSWWSFI